MSKRGRDLGKPIQGPDEPAYFEPATGEDVEVVAVAMWRWLQESADGYPDTEVLDDWTNGDEDEKDAARDGARAILAALDLPGREQALREENEGLRRQVDLLTTANEAYWAAQTELDRLLGTEEEDGSGAGLAAEVRLLGEQRDAANAELRGYDECPFGLHDRRCECRDVVPPS